MKHIYSIACVLLTSISGFAQVPTNGLVARYDFSDTPDFYADGSGNALFMCPTGTPIIDVGPTAGDSTAYFNGTSKMYYCGGAGNFMTSSASISAWFKLSQSMPYNTIACVRYNDASAPYNTINLYTGTGAGSKVAFAFSTDTQTDVIVQGTSAVSYGVWYHAVATYDASTGTASLYVNGVLEDVVNGAPENLIYTNDAFTIGNVPAGNSTDISNAFVGHINQVLYYDRALSTEEVCEIYTGANCTVTAPDAPTNLAASVNQFNQVDLFWIDNSSDETGFKVERSSNGGASYVEILDLPANTTATTDASVSPGMTYHYRVYAYNANGASNVSNVDEVTTNTVGLTENILISEVFPNPVDDKLSVTLNATAEVKLVGLTGEILATYSFDKGENTLQLAHLSSGIYFLQSGTNCVKFVKK